MMQGYLTKTRDNTDEKPLNVLINDGDIEKSGRNTRIFIEINTNNI